MSLNIANGASQGNSGANATATTPVKTTTASGSGFVAAFNYDSARTLNSVTDSKGNTYTLVGAGLTDGPGGFKTAVYLCASGTGGANHTVTGTLDTTGLISAFFAEITTTNAGGVTLDQATQGADTASPFVSPNITTLVAAELLVSFLGGNSGSGTATHNASANSFTIVTGADVVDGVNQWTGALATRAVSSTGTYAASWTESLGSRTGVHIFSVSEAAGGGPTTTTVTPDKATLTLSGRAATTSAFSNVRIREVLVNGSGQLVGSATDITLLVWYSGRFGGAPDVSINGLTTDANGTTSWSIATGTLAYNDPIAYVAQNSVSLSHYAAARMTPSYE